MFRDWSVSRGQDGYSVQLLEVPRWARMVSATWDRFCALTRHSFCNPPEWLFKIPVGRIRRDEDGYLENSLGGAMYGFTNKVLCVDWNRQVVRLTLPVSDEVGKDLWGSDSWDDDEEDDDGRRGEGSSD